MDKLVYSPFFLPSKSNYDVSSKILSVLLFMVKKEVFE